MPYPLVQLPTWKELIEQLSGHGVSFKRSECELKSSDGCEPISYFEQENVGRYVVYFDNDQERVMPSVLRSICAALKIDPSEFGLDLG
jgi:hypothetical protein